MADRDGFQPALSRWGHTWRAVVVVAISTLAVAGGSRQDGLGGARSLLVLDLVMAAVAFVVMWFRRRAPLPAALLTSAMTAVSAGPIGPAALCLTSLATRRRYRPIALAAAVNVAGSLVFALAVAGDPEPIAAEVLGAVVPVAALVGWGLFVGSRRELVWNLRQRAERAEATQELRAAEARATERTRIAREMHDVVAHRISQVSMRAGALAFRSDLSTDQMRAESAVIRDAANEALRELRSVLQVLRDPASGALIDQPQPTFGDIAELVGGARRNGAHVELVDTVHRPVPTDVGRSLYRIVQEGLTNAAKHAPGARVHVSLSEADDGITLTMSNPLGFTSTATPGAGLGLVGIAERVAVAGGRFEHGVLDGHFTMRAWLPWAT